MNMFKLLILILLSIVTISCQGLFEPTPTPRDLTDTNQCGQVCAHLESLGCEEGKPLEDGTTCKVFCEEFQNKGHKLDLQCMGNIQNCEQIQTKCSQ